MATGDCESFTYNYNGLKIPDARSIKTCNQTLSIEKILCCLTTRPEHDKKQTVDTPSNSEPEVKEYDQKFI